MNDTKIKDLSKLFASKGYNVVIGTTFAKQEEWLSYFRGNVNNVHHFQRKSMSGRRIDMYKPSLQMPKKVAEEWTSLLYNEKVELITGSTDSQLALDEVLLDNHFTDEIVTFIELVMGAYGEGVIIEYIADDKVKLNFIYGDKIMVIGYENSTVTDIAVIDEFEKDKMAYTHVMYHEVDNELYRITHEMYVTKAVNKGLGKECSLDILFSEQEINEMKHTEANEHGVEFTTYYMEYESKPHFQVFKPAIVNNHDVKSPRGMPTIANALGSFNGIDNKSFNLDREDSLTRTRIFVDDRVMEWSKIKDSQGNVQSRKYFDEEEDVYQIIKGMVDTDTPVVTSNPTYDSAPRIEAIKLDLAFIGFDCGLGTDYFSFDNGSVYVNEANVIASNSDTWRNRNKHINRLKPVLTGMIKAIMFLKEIKIDESKVEVIFDDDIITDDSARKKEIGELIEKGIISIQEGQKMFYGESKTPEELEIIYIQTLVEKQLPLTPAQAEKYNGTVTVENKVVPPTEDQEE